MINLLLIRHGHTEPNTRYLLCGWTDYPLSSLGKRQAHRLARYLAEGCRLDSLHTSPLRRALETAEVIATRCGLAPVPHDPLKEIWFGDAEGLSEEEFRVKYPDHWAELQDPGNLDFCWPNGESRLEFHRRISRAIEGLVQENGGRTVAVVSHGGVIATYLAGLLEGGWRNWRSFMMDNCGIAELRFARDGPPRLVRHNDTSFL